jgi:hypothetical protein
MASIGGAIYLRGMEATDFLAELLTQIARARRQDLRHIEISIAELLRLVGRAPYSQQSVQLCRDVMRNAMRAGDQVVSAPPYGAWFTVRYQVAHAQAS